MVRGGYERIRGEEPGTSGLGPTPGYGSLYQSAVEDMDPENPFTPDIRIVHQGRPRQRNNRITNFVVAPALIVLLLGALSVALLSGRPDQSLESSPPTEAASGPDTPILVNPSTNTGTSVWDDIKKDASSVIASAKQKASDLKKEAQPVVDQMKKNATAVIEDAKKKAGPVIDDAKKKGAEVVDEAKKKAADAKQKIADAQQKGSTEAKDDAAAVSHKANATVADAKAKGSAVIQEAKKNATAAITEAQHKANATIADAKAKGASIIANAEVAVGDTLAQANDTANSVFSCLDEQCTPLVSSLGKAFKDLVNLNLLSCLVAAGRNKSQAADCFAAAGPSTLRDNLVNCAGCNGCIELSDQDGIDKACQKYAAWTAKQKAITHPTDGTTTELGANTDLSTGAHMLSSPPPDAAIPEGSLYAALPKTLRERYCSTYW